MDERGDGASHALPPERSQRAVMTELVSEQVIILEIASLDMPLEQPPRETPRLKSRSAEHQEFYLQQYS